MAENYKSELANNTIWNAIENYSMTGIQLLFTFILARFLAPADFGIVGMLTVFTAIAQTIIDSGFAQAIIREKYINDKDYSTIFYFNIGISIVIYIILYFSSPLIAQFYHLPVLNNICKVLFLIIPFNALCIVQTARLRRNMYFKKLCITSLCASLLSCIIAIIIATYLKNVWAIVIQMVLSYCLRSIILFIIGKWHPILYFSWGTLSKYFQFSKNLLAAGLIGNIFNNIHAILIGKFYTTTDLGYYSQADRMRNVSSQTSTSVIQNVTYPIFSKINNNEGNLLIAYKKVIIISLIYVGLIISFLMSISEDLFQILMGSESWRIAGRYFCYLGIAGILYPLHSINQNILLVKAKSKNVMLLEIARRSIMLIILSVTINYDIKFFILSNSLYSILLLFLNLYFCGKPINYSLMQQLKDIMPILFRLGIIILISMISNQVLSNHNIVLRIAVTSTLYVITSIILFVKNSYFIEVTSSFRTLLARRIKRKNNIPNS